MGLFPKSAIRAQYPRKDPAKERHRATPTKPAQPKHPKKKPSNARKNHTQIASVSQTPIPHLVKTCQWYDLWDIEDLYADCHLNSPLTHAILTDDIDRRDTDNSRRDLGRFIYGQALQAHESQVLKAIDLTAAPGKEMQACFWLQWISSQRTMELGSSSTSDKSVEAGIPEFLNERVYQNVEKVIDARRERMMEGKSHYFLRALDFALTPLGKRAARDLLGRINATSVRHPILAFTRPEHEDLYRDMGWRFVGYVPFRVHPDHVIAPYLLSAYMKPGKMQVVGAVRAVNGVASEIRARRRMNAQARGGDGPNNPIDLT